jgi:hypothetical protein
MSRDYSASTGDALVEHYAAVLLESHPDWSMEYARAIVDIAPDLQGLLGRADAPYARVKALRLAGLPLTPAEAAELAEADADLDRRLAGE